MKKEEKTESTCNNHCDCDCVLKKVLIALACGTILGALITTGVFLLVRKTEQPSYHCYGHVRCPHTPIKFDDEYRFKYDSEVELQDYLKEKKADESTTKKN